GVRLQLERAGLKIAGARIAEWGGGSRKMRVDVPLRTIASAAFHRRRPGMTWRGVEQIEHFLVESRLGRCRPVDRRNVRFGCIAHAVGGKKCCGVGGNHKIHSLGMEIPESFVLYEGPAEVRGPLVGVDE